MEISRRLFVKGSLATVGLGAAATMGGVGARTAPLELDLDTVQEVLQTPVMLSIVDGRKAEFELLIGESAIPFTDPALASRLARAARGR